MLAEQQQAKEAAAYNRFVLDELTAANLTEGEQEELEEALEKLSHFEEISQHLYDAVEVAEAEETGLRAMLYRFKNDLEKIAAFSSDYKDMAGRIQNLYLEFIDLADEVLNESENMAFDPSEMERVSSRLGLLFDLQKKYKAVSVKELIELKEDMSRKVEMVENASEQIEEKQKQVKKAKVKLQEVAEKIRKNRKKAIAVFIEKLHRLLGQLEMKNTVIKIDLTPLDEFRKNGSDTIAFLISSNAGKTFETVKKAASGGEMSRLMLAVKTILSEYTRLPSIIFDEIDTGVSGEVSNRIADVMQQMSKNMQVITITHLPQIAARGKQHYKVFKEVDGQNIRSQIRLLNDSERIGEIAEMLGGRPVTESALAHAKQLLTH